MKIKIVIASIGTFFMIAMISKLLINPIIISLKMEGVKIVFTSLVEPFILQLKFMIFSGLAGIAIVMGLEFQKNSSWLVRLVIMILPTTVIALITYIILKTRIVTISKMSNEAFGIQSAFQLSNIHLELIPVAGFVTATLLATLLFFKNRQQLTAPDTTPKRR